MPPRKKVIPQDRGFYISERDYSEHAMFEIEHVTLYSRSHAGFWFANGERIEEKDVPGDLWPVRMVQK